jgi:ribosomal protein L3
LADKDVFQQSSNNTASFRYRLPLTRSISLEPSVGIIERWQSHQDLGLVLDTRDITQGRGFTGLNWRHRVTSSVDYDLAHRYREWLQTA